ncbi:MAG: hypothetical protein IT381_11045 [Deltaproteobacteria bacterium]|nr:hypothetical protein [Deltaproteobacteria bacterium]
MIRAFIRKELQQHGTYVAVATSLAALIVLLDAFSELSHDPSLDAFAAGRGGLRIALVVVALVVSSRLVRKEYAEKTQLFLEALPLSRAHMVLMKAGIGLAHVLACGGAFTAIAFLVERRNPLLTAAFVAQLGARILAFATAAYGVCFLLGFFGRYRVPIVIATALALIYLNDRTTFDVLRVGPFALMDETFATERGAWPARALLISLAIGVGALAVSVLLASLREGSLAAMLGEKMSRREAMFFVVAILFGASAIFAATPKKAREPFTLASAAPAEGGGVRVRVADLAGRTEADQTIAESLRTSLAAAARALDIAELPPVFVTGRDDLDPALVEVDLLPDNEGVIVRGDYPNPRFDRTRLFCAALHHALVLHSGGRLFIEETHWLLDGFSRYFVLSGGAGEIDGAVRDRGALRVLYAKDLGLSAQDFDRWSAYRERVGDDLGEAVAASLLLHLRERYGEASVTALARTVLGRQVPKDFRALFDRRRNAPRRLIEAATKRSFEAIVADWLAALELTRSPLAAALARIPRFAGAPRIDARGKSDRQIRFDLALAPLPRRVRLYYQTIDPLTGELSRETMRRVDKVATAASDYDLGETFQRGQVVFVDAAAHSDALDCEVSLGGRRLVLE